MYIRYDIVTKKGGYVADFPTEQAALQYLSSTTIPDLSIKKKRIFDPIDWVTAIALVVGLRDLMFLLMGTISMLQAIALIGVVSYFAGYLCHHLVKKHSSKPIAILFSLATGGICFMLIATTLDLLMKR